MKIKSILCTLLLTALVACGDGDSVNVNTHGERIDLIEAVNKLQDEILGLHDARITALEKKSDGQGKQIVDLETGLEKAINDAADNLVKAVTALEAADASQLVELEALRLAILANTTLDNERFSDISDDLLALSKRITDEAKYSKLERTKMKREYREKYKDLRQRLRNVRKSLSTRIVNLRNNFKSHKLRTNGRLNTLENELYRECFEERPRLFILEEGPEEECVDGILARLSSLELDVDSNGQSIASLQSELTSLTSVVNKNKIRSKANKQKINNLTRALDAAVIALEAADTNSLELLKQLIIDGDSAVTQAAQAALDAAVIVLEAADASAASVAQSALNTEVERLEQLIIGGDEAVSTSAQAALDIAISVLEASDARIQARITRVRNLLATRITSVSTNIRMLVTANRQTTRVLQQQVNRLISTVDIIKDRLTVVEGSYQTANDITVAITNALISINDQILILSSNSSTNIADLQLQITNLTNALETIELTRGPRGKKGKKGDDGASGIGCTIVEATGGANITCGETTVFISDGADGEGYEGDEDEGNEDEGLELTASSVCREIGDSGLYYKQSTGWDSVHFYFEDSSCSGNGDKDNLLGGPSGTQSIVDYYGMTFVIVSEAKGSNVFTVTLDDD